MAEREAGWKSLRDKVDALLRALVGDGQPRATDRVTGKRGRSPLEVTLCADGYDERTGQHSAPKLTRREMLELVGEAALRLDEATRQVGELQQFLPNAAEQVIVPVKIADEAADGTMLNFAERIPQSLVSILTPEVADERVQLATSAKQRKALTDKDKEDIALQVGKAQDAMKKACELQREMRMTRTTVPKRFTNRKLEPGWLDTEAEKRVMAAALYGTNKDSPYAMITTAMKLGLQASDLGESPHQGAPDERTRFRAVWEAIERAKGKNALRDDRDAHIESLRPYFLPLPAKSGAKQNQTQDEKVQDLLKQVQDNLRPVRLKAGELSEAEVADLVASIVLKGRLSRMTSSILDGRGLRVESKQAMAARAAAAQAAGAARGATSTGRSLPVGAPVALAQGSVSGVGRPQQMAVQGRGGSGAAMGGMARSGRPAQQGAAQQGAAPGMGGRVPGVPGGGRGGGAAPGGYPLNPKAPGR